MFGTNAARHVFFAYIPTFGVACLGYDAYVNLAQFRNRLFQGMNSFSSLFSGTVHWNSAKDLYSRMVYEINRFLWTAATICPVGSGGGWFGRRTFLGVQYIVVGRWCPNLSQ